MKNAFLGGHTIALSISNSPDLAVLGLGKEHLDDAMTEIARHLIACGATLAYGGDLREGGFTELLFEIARYAYNPRTLRPFDKEDHMLENLRRLILNGTDYVQPPTDADYKPRARGIGAAEDLKLK